MNFHVDWTVLLAVGIGILSACTAAIARRVYRLLQKMDTPLYGDERERASDLARLLWLIHCVIAILAFGAAVSFALLLVPVTTY